MAPLHEPALVAATSLLSTLHTHGDTRRSPLKSPLIITRPSGQL